MKSILVRLEHVSVAFEAQTVLRDISLQLLPEDIVTLIGPNGAGKTTLVKVILGLLPASSGTVVRQPGLRIGYMPQKLTVDPTLPLTVHRFLRLAGASSRVVDDVMARVDIQYLRKTPIQSVSGGELQRTLLARSILRKPELLVLDEPAQGVDVTGQSKLYDLIRSLRDELHCGVLMISHDLHLVMAATDTVLCLNQHMCCSGHPDQVSNDPAFLELFGRKPAESLAVYHHHHDHEHTIHGDVVHHHGCEAGKE